MILFTMSGPRTWGATRRRPQSVGWGIPCHNFESDSVTLATAVLKFYDGHQ